MLMIILLFSSLIAEATSKFTLTLSNNSFLVRDQTISLGSVGIKGCKSPGMVDLNQISLNSTLARCVEVKKPGSFEIFFVIPINISLTSTQNMTLSLTKVNSTTDFSSLYFADGRNLSLSQGTDLLSVSRTMKNGDLIQGQLELGAMVYGPSTKNSYSSEIVFTIGPSI